MTGPDSLKSIASYDEALVEDLSRSADAQPENARDTILTGLSLAQDNLESAERRLELTIRAAREQHISWAAIGATFGISRQAAWERWSKVTEEVHE